ncbi:very short patch repair endonuclease [Fundidesulfovibrio putealis]|uniref:very short patch repair endonuclease n=1 Tax=Fundidesulfovibrio putealis TaxID=270496 RepID=UPI000A06302C|nr:very short patch repair endonuclease [Fundidesulfovibrio putealis]
MKKGKGDCFTPEKRSEVMSRIRGRDTGPELALRRALWSSGLRYRTHPALPGKPDIAFISRKVAIFVDGCFWHGCPLHGVMPGTNQEFWSRKIGRNIERDRETNARLEKEGWVVLRFWEHEVEKALQDCVTRVRDVLSEKPVRPAR